MSDPTENALAKAEARIAELEQKIKNAKAERCEGGCECCDLILAELG